MSLLTFATLLAFNRHNQSVSYPVELAVKSYGMVPDLIQDVSPLNFIIMSKGGSDHLPSGGLHARLLLKSDRLLKKHAVINVKYSSRLQVTLGNVLGLNQVQEEPIYVGFYACPDRYYSLFMLDPDVPSRTNTSLAEVRHWHVGNIPADDVAAGETLAMYMGPIPDPGTGPHRYTFLVYRQKRKLVFTEKRLLDTSGEGRTGFSLMKYVRKYNLELIAASFFQAEFGNNGCLQGFTPVVQ